MKCLYEIDTLVGVYSCQCVVLRSPRKISNRAFRWRHAPVRGMGLVAVVEMVLMITKLFFNSYRPRYDL